MESLTFIPQFSNAELFPIICGINLNLTVVKNIILISGKNYEKNILDQIFVCILGIRAIC
jgi:hypothetical protein